MAKATPVKLEKIMLKLEGILQKLEDEDVDLEDSIKAFEEGIKLSRAAQEVLAEAEQKVQMLLDEDGEPTAVPLSQENETQ